MVYASFYEWTYPCGAEKITANAKRMHRKTFNREKTDLVEMLIR